MKESGGRPYVPEASEPDGRSFADILVDRQLIKKRVWLWRFAFFFTLALLGLFFIFSDRILAGRYGFSDGTVLLGRDRIVRFPIDGIISDDPKQREALISLSRDPHVKAVILAIDSPGGSTFGTEALYETLLKVKKSKPVVALLGTVAASGGYAVALPTDRIIARGNTITGSVGVIMQWQDMSEALRKIGVQTHTVASSSIKGQPSRFRKVNKEAIQSLQESIDASYEWFLGLVCQNRHMSRDQARKLSDGRIYTGWQAQKNGLIDEIGGQDEAVDWLRKEKKISPKVPVQRWVQRGNPWGSLGALSLDKIDQFLARIAFKYMISRASGSDQSS